jgi:class 3 adenylate cyclase
VQHAEWLAAAALGEVMIVSHFCGLVAFAQGRRALGFFLLSAKLVLHAKLRSHFRVWVTNALTLVLPGTAIAGQLVALLRLCVVVTFIPAVLDVSGAFVSLNAHEALFAMGDIFISVVWSHALLRCDTLLRDVSLRQTRDALDARRTEQFAASLQAEHAHHDSLLKSVHQMVQEVTAPLSVIAGLSDKLLSDVAMADELPELQTVQSGRRRTSAPRDCDSTSSAPSRSALMSVPRTSLTPLQRSTLSLSVIKDSASRVGAEFAALLGAVASRESTRFDRFAPASLEQLLEQSAATYSLLLRPGVGLVVNTLPDVGGAPLRVANGDLVDACLHAALQLANLCTFSGTVALAVEPLPAASTDNNVRVHVTCEHAQLSVVSSDDFETSIDYLTFLAQGLGGTADCVLGGPDGGCLCIALLLPLYEPGPGTESSVFEPSPRRMASASPTHSDSRRRSSAALVSLANADDRRYSYVSERERSQRSSVFSLARSSTSVDGAAFSEVGVGARPRLLCFRIMDPALNAALQDPFELYFANTVEEVLAQLSDPERVYAAVLVSCSLDSSAFANLESQTGVSRIRAAGSSLPILMAVFGGAESLVAAAAVATAIATATVLAAACVPEAVPTMELAAGLLVKSSPLVCSAEVLASTAAVLLVQPDPAVLDQLTLLAVAPRTSETAFVKLLPVLATAPVLASVVTQGALRAAEALGDVLSRAALQAGATKCFDVPLRRMELVDRIATYLETLKLTNSERSNAELLRKLLPERVSDKLKVGQSFYAEAMPSITILFCDICSFTVIASLLDPIQIIVLLNELFSAFDSLMEKHGVFKVESACAFARACTHHALTRSHIMCVCAPKAIGDCIMVRVPLPAPDPRRSAFPFLFRVRPRSPFLTPFNLLRE